MQLFLTAWYLLKKVEKVEIEDVVEDAAKIGRKMGVAVFANLIQLIAEIGFRFASSHHGKPGFRHPAMVLNPRSRTRRRAWGSYDGDVSISHCHLRVSDLKSNLNGGLFVYLLNK